MTNKNPGVGWTIDSKKAPLFSCHDFMKFSESFRILVHTVGIFWYFVVWILGSSMIHSKFINSSPWSNPLVGSLAVLWDLYGSDATKTEPIPKWNPDIAMQRFVGLMLVRGLRGCLREKQHVGNSKDSRKPDEPGIFLEEKSFTWMKLI